MAAKKPRKIKDLKARLGRTIAPTTEKGGEDIAPPPGAAAAAPTAAPAGAAAPKPKPKPAGGVVAPPGMAKPPGGGGLVAPPFAQPKSEAPKSVRPADPFAAAEPAAGGPQEVRLVFDDKPVEDAEVGRKRKGRTIMLLGIGVVLGLILGFGTGSVMNHRKLHNTAVRDGKDLYDAVREASNRLSEAQTLVDRAVGAARGGPGKAPAVDYEAIQGLRALEKPFTASTFSRKQYGLFETSTVDSLFDYYNHINQIWDRIEALQGLTAGEQRQAELNEAAEAASGSTSALTGCLVTFDSESGRWLCNLGYVRVPDDAQETGKVMVRASRRARREVEKEIFTGQELNAENQGNFVVLVNAQQSIGVLGEQASLFAEYVRDIGALKAQLDETVEVQGRLESSLGTIANNEEVFAF